MYAESFIPSAHYLQFRPANQRINLAELLVVFGPAVGKADAETQELIDDVSESCESDWWGQSVLTSGHVVYDQAGQDRDQVDAQRELVEFDCSKKILSYDISVSFDGKDNLW